MMRKILTLIFVLFLLVPGALGDVVTEHWVDVPTGSKVTTLDMGKNGDVVVAGTENGHIVKYNADGLNEWDVLPFGAVAVTEILYPPEQTTFVYVRVGTTVKQLSLEDGSVIWTATLANLVDFDCTKDGGLIVLISNTVIETLNGAGTIVGSRYITQDGPNSNGNYGQVILDPDGTWVAASRVDSVGTLQLFSYNDRTASWQMQGYTYRREHRIVGSSEGPLTNYGTNITVYRTSGTTTGDKIYIDTNCRSDYNDIRFVIKSTGEVLQHTKIGAVTNGMQFTVKIPQIAKSQNYDIYVYYGNPSASTDVSNSNGIVYGASDVYLTNIAGNWMMEESGGWTPTATTSNINPGTESGWIYGEAAQVTVPATDWKTQGQSSLYLREFDGIYQQSNYLTVHYADANTHATQTFPGFTGEYVGFTKANMIFDAKFQTTNYYAKCNKGTPPVNAATSNLILSSGSSTWQHDITGNGVYTNNNNVLKSISKGATVTADVVSGHERGTEYSTYYAITLTAVNAHDAVVYIDNVRFQPVVTYPPTHSTWGVVQQYNVYDTTLRQATTLGSNIRFSDMAWSGDVFTLTTNAKVYQIAVTGNTAWAVNSMTVSGTPNTLKTASGANYIIEGRGTYMYMYRSSPTLDASFSFGNTVNVVDIAEASGDWAITGSNDGTLKLFSKVNASEWYFAWSTAPDALVSAAAFSERGHYFVYGLENGQIKFYSTTATTTIIPDIYTTIHVYNDGSPYGGGYVDVGYGGEYGHAYVPIETNKRLDSDGEFVLFGITGHYYNVDIKDENNNIIASKQIQISRTDFDKHIYIYAGITPYDEHVSNVVEYGATFNDTNSQIEFFYNDPDGITDSVTVKIIEISPTSTYTVVYDNIWYNSVVIDAYAASPDNTYRVDVLFERENQEYSETFICTPIGRWHIEFPIPAEVRVGCFAILLICILALFPPDYRGVGAVAGMGFNTYFYAIGALPNPWWLLAVGWIAAIFYLFGRVQDGGL